MSDSTPKDVRVFFSWQSDSPKEMNLSPMRKAIDAAHSGVRKKFPHLSLVRDEATRDTSGSPNIAKTLFQKIDVSDIFVADITTVTPEGVARPSANPNVLIELGYAVAQLGWDRIVLLFNESLGTFPNDLPFDIVQNRVTRFHLGLPDSAGTAEHVLELRKLVLGAILAVVEKNPKFPRELQSKSPEAIRHERDVENIRWLLEQVHFPTLDDHVGNVPHMIEDRVLSFWEGFRFVARSSLFYLYDTELKKRVEDVFDSWRDTVRFGERYHPASNPAIYVFSNSDVFQTKEQEADWNTIEQAASRLHFAKTALLDWIRDRYLEVDIDETSTHAYARWRKEQALIMTPPAGSSD